jgi:hypothetical protein
LASEDVDCGRLNDLGGSANDFFRHVDGLDFDDRVVVMRASVGELDARSIVRKDRADESDVVPVGWSV